MESSKSIHTHTHKHTINIVQRATASNHYRYSHAVFYLEVIIIDSLKDFDSA